MFANAERKRIQEQGNMTRFMYRCETSEVAGLSCEVTRASENVRHHRLRFRMLTFSKWAEPFRPEVRLAAPSPQPCVLRANA
jgi:hypothetical protein